MARADHPADHGRRPTAAPASCCMAAASESDHRALGYTALTTVVLNPAVVIVPTPPFNALSSRRPRVEETTVAD